MPFFAATPKSTHVQKTLYELKDADEMRHLAIGAGARVVDLVNAKTGAVHDTVPTMMYAIKTSTTTAPGALADATDAQIEDNLDKYTEQYHQGFYLQYLAAIVEQYGLPVPGPKDIPAQYLRCKYRMRNGGGRLYPHGMRTLQDRGEARSVCIQSAPRELRSGKTARGASS